jgi:hypothetical protein
VTAGFSAERATTPQGRARFATLPERQIVERRAPGGESTDLFSDPGNCCCVYVGDAEEYARYLALEEHVVRERKRDLDVVLFGDSSRYATVPPDPPVLVALPEARGCSRADV